MTLHEKITATPGLLEKFKHIIVSSSSSEWVHLTPSQKYLYEEYKTQLTAA